MGLEALLASLERRSAVTPATHGATAGVTCKPAPALACTAVTSVTAANDVLANETSASRWWLIHFPDREVEICCVPTVTYAEAMAACPGSVAATPLPARPCREATPGERDELARLLATILPGDPAGQREALAIALSDVTDALVCFRQLAGNQQPRLVTNDATATKRQA